MASRLWLVSWSLWLLGGPLSAGTVLLYEQGRGVEQTLEELAASDLGEARIDLEAGKARYDGHGSRFFLRQRDPESPEGGLFIQMHGPESFVRIEVPIRLDALLSPEEAADHARFLSVAGEETTIRRVGETRRIAGLVAEKVEVRSVLAIGVRLDVDLWLTRELKVDAAPLHALFRAMHALQPVGYDWLEAVLSVEGAVPVRIEETQRDSRQVVRSLTRLVEVLEKDLPDERFEPPPGAVERPFRLSDSTAFQGGQ